MTTVQDLLDEVMAQLRPWDGVEMTPGQFQTWLASATNDARNSGVLFVLEDDESLTFLANTYEYNVPATFAYVRYLLVENTATTPSTWEEAIPLHQWTMREDGGVPKFIISRDWPIAVGLKMKVVGQRRPTINSSGATGLAETIDMGLESFYRERVMWMALRFQATGNQALQMDPKQITQAQLAYQTSEAMLARHPGEHRVRPNSRLVPLR